MILSFQLRPARTVGSRGAVKKLFKKKKKEEEAEPTGKNESNDNSQASQGKGGRIRLGEGAREVHGRPLPGIPLSFQGSLLPASPLASSL